MPFEVFDKRTVLAPAEPLVTIQKRGFISLNHAAFRALGEPKAVELLYDQAKKVVGLRTAGPGIPTAYPVRPNTKGTSYIVSGMAFTKHYGIDTTVARRWPAQMKSSVLCVDIGKRPISTGSG
jgi:hypothetical protein